MLTKDKNLVMKMEKTVKQKQTCGEGNHIYQCLQLIIIAYIFHSTIQYINLQQWETVTAGVLNTHLHKFLNLQCTPTQSDLETVHSSHKSLHHHNSQSPIQTPSDRHGSHQSITSAKEQLVMQLNQASSDFIEPQFHEETYCEPASTHDNTHIKTSLSQGVVRKQLITKQQKSLTSSNPALSDHVVAVSSVGEQSKTRNGHFQYRNASIQTGLGNSQKISQSQSPMPNIAKLTRREEREKVLKEGEVLQYGCGLRNAKKGSFVARWTQVTENKLRYYKNQIAAYQHPGKPLVSVPLGDILDIVKTRINRQEVQIEFILAKELSFYVQERHLVDRAYQSPKRTPSISGQPITPDREVKPGHLLRMPHSRNNTSMAIPIQNISIIMENSSLNQAPKYSPFKTFQQTNLIDHPEDYMEEQNKSFEANVNLPQQSASWSRRESIIFQSDWYSIEEKLIFKNNVKNVMDGDQSQIDIWVKLIKERSQKCAKVNNISAIDK